MDRLRDRYARPTEGDIDLSSLPAGDDTPGLHEDLASLEHELSRLPVVEREVLTLFYLRELSLAEVAGVLEIPVGTVKSRLSRGREALAQALSTDEEVDHV